MGPALDKIEEAFNKLTVFLAALVAVSIALIAFFIPLNLFMVKMNLGGIWWLFEGVEYVLFIGVFIGAPWVLQQNAHVRVDVVISNLPKAAAAKLERFVDIMGFLLCTLLFIYGVRATIVEFVDMTYPDKDLRIANWFVLSFFALSFLLLAIEFLLRMRRAKVILDKEETAASEAGF